MISILGGKCVRCGFDGHWASFDFHHVNRKMKRFSIAGVLKWPEADFIALGVDEVTRECVLLCANCHRVITVDRDERNEVYLNWRIKHKRKNDLRKRIIDRGLMVSEIPS